MKIEQTTQKETVCSIEEFITDVLEKADADGALVAMSGGIDSSTVASLAVRALGKENVKALILPSESNRASAREDAVAHAKSLEIEYTVIDIERIVRLFVDKAGINFDSESSEKITVGNTRVRTRAVLNYMFANAENRVVLGTGNKSEALTGYFTKYGDQAVDCNPIGDLYKTEVRELAREIGVPEKIIEKPPSAGMWDGQEDEEEIGIPYETLDKVLEKCIEGKAQPETVAHDVGVSAEGVRRVIELHRKSEHKRKIPPSPDLD